jgi:hypothetical protein
MGFRIFILFSFVFNKKNFSLQDLLCSRLLRGLSQKENCCPFNFFFLGFGFFLILKIDKDLLFS